MTKEELIKEAWGALYESVKNSLNHTNGEFLIESCFFYEDDFYKKELFDTEVYNESLLIIRPKSLQGIETNNGWKRIEGQHNLPDIDTDYWCVYKGEVTKRSFNHHLPRSVEFWTDNITHYQPIVKPEPPLY